MKTSFVEPDFMNGSIEFRFDGNEVCVYCSPEGLKWLAQECLSLVADNKKKHVHLTDYQVLTEKSVAATLAIFP